LFAILVSCTTVLSGIQPEHFKYLRIVCGFFINDKKIFN